MYAVWWQPLASLPEFGVHHYAAFSRLLSPAKHVRPNGIEQLRGRCQPWSLALVDRRHDRYVPSRQRAERCLRLRVIEQRLVERWGDDHWCAAADRLGGD